MVDMICLCYRYSCSFSFIYSKTLSIHTIQWKEMKPIYQIHVYFAEKVQALLYVETVAMSILFTTLFSC